MAKQRVRKEAPTRDANAAQRASLAVELRTQKYTYREIAEKCGYASAQVAHKAVMRELDRTIVHNVEELRQAELDGLDKLEQECWDRLHDSVHDKAKLFAVDRILAIKDRRSKLMGLDALKSDGVVSAQVVIRDLPPGYFDSVDKK